MAHTRIRKFNTRDTYPEQKLDNDLCQAVVANDTVYLRGQIGQDLDTRESVGIGDVAAQADIAPWLEQYYSVNENWVADDRRKLLAFARDLMNSDYAGHRLTFQLFAQSPPFAHLGAVFRNFDFDTPLGHVQKAAGLSERVLGSADKPQLKRVA